MVSLEGDYLAVSSPPFTMRVDYLAIFTISVHPRFGLIRGVTFDGSVLIREGHPVHVFHNKLPQTNLDSYLICKVPLIQSKCMFHFLC